MHQFFWYLAILGAVCLEPGYVIATTTVFVDIFPISTVPVHAAAFTALTLSVKASAKAIATPIVNSTNTNTNTILQAGDADVVGFYTNISSCLSNVTLALEAAVSNLVPEVSSLAHEVGSNITKGASKATLFTASPTSGIPGAVSTAKSIAKSIESKINSVAPALATSLFHEATSDIAAAAKSVASKLHLPFKPRGKIETRRGLTDITSEFFNTSDIDPYFKPKSKPRALPSLEPRNLTTLSPSPSACISAAADTNPLFQIGDCAFHIAELVTPASKILKLKDLIEGAGGAMNVVPTLGNAKDATSVVKIGGQGVLDVLKGALGHVA
ncbi:hypothetical protein BDZ45DRAFT_729752 [Acephala macrosclerotiorum]|nr:hypothetical protein BDZ45DRAFT_729752 [Acephala macrosclerotiorum]